MENTNIITASHVFPSRNNEIMKRKKELKLMEEIQTISFQVYKFLKERIDVKNENEFDNAQEIEIYPYWIQEKEWGSLTYIDPYEILNFLRNLKKETVHSVLGYVFMDNIGVSRRKDLSNQNLMADLMLPSDCKKNFNMIKSVVIASPDHKRMWKHVEWRLGNKTFKNKIV